MESVDPASNNYGEERTDSSFGYGMNYNPIDPYNMYPQNETGEEVYGLPPMLGCNKHHLLYMKLFNPNMFGSLFGVPVMQPLLLPPTTMTTLIGTHKLHHCKPTFLVPY